MIGGVRFLNVSKKQIYIRLKVQSNRLVLVRFLSPVVKVKMIGVRCIFFQFIIAQSSLFPAYFCYFLINFCYFPVYSCYFLINFCWNFWGFIFPVYFGKSGIKFKLIRFFFQFILQKYPLFPVYYSKWSLFSSLFFK